LLGLSNISNFKTEAKLIEVDLIRMRKM